MTSLIYNTGKMNKRERPMKIFKYVLLILMTLLVSSCSITGQSQTKDEATQSTASNTSGPQDRNLKILASTKYLSQMIQELAGSDHIVNYMAETESQLKSLAPDPSLIIYWGRL